MVFTSEPCPPGLSDCLDKADSLLLSQVANGFYNVPIQKTAF